MLGNSGDKHVMNPTLKEAWQKYVASRKEALIKLHNSLAKLTEYTAILVRDPKDLSDTNLRCVMADMERRQAISLYDQCHEAWIASVEIVHGSGIGIKWDSNGNCTLSNGEVYTRLA